jgi:hypothetical protein
VQAKPASQVGGMAHAPCSVVQYSPAAHSRLEAQGVCGAVQVGQQSVPMVMVASGAHRTSGHTRGAPEDPPEGPLTPPGPEDEGALAKQ